MTDWELIVVGVDHGFGNMKTAHCSFPSGLIQSDAPPTFKSNLLVYKDRYYQIGAAHKAFCADKSADDEYYILTLAAIAAELVVREISRARVYLAVGLPLTWVSEQRTKFTEYLMQNPCVTFLFEGKPYQVEFVGVLVYPQGFAAVSDRLQSLSGINLLADVGNGTMNVMYIIDSRPQIQKCYTEKFGTYQCLLQVREVFLRKFGIMLVETEVERFLRTGTADIDAQYLHVIRQVAVEYVQGIFRVLRDHEYAPEMMKLIVVGGGGCLIRNFADIDLSRVVFVDDISATAKGYELMARKQLGM